MKHIFLHKLALTLLFASSFHSVQIKKPSTLGVIAAGAFDSASTMAVLQDHPGWREQNPAFRPFTTHGWPIAIGSMAAYDLMMSKLADHIGKRHPRIKAIILTTLVTDHVLGGIHNLRGGRGFDGI